MNSPLPLLPTGLRELLRLPRPVLLGVAGCFLFAVLCLPWWRVGPEDAGSWLAPLAVDSGYLHRRAPQVDFYAVAEAGWRLRNGEDPYGSVAPEHLGHAPYATEFRYFPINLYWAAWPLSLPPARAAAALWTTAGLLLLALNFVASVAILPKRAGLLALLWFVWFPLIPEWHLGQFNLLTGTLLFWTALALFRGWRAGWAACWMLAAWLKLFPLALVPWLWSRGWRGSVAAVVVVLAATTGTWMGVRGDSAFAKQLLSRDLDSGLLARSDLPYAGAQGLAAGVNATVWKLRGLSFDPEAAREVAPLSPDPVLVASLLLAASWTGLAVWIALRARRWRTFAPLAFLWLGWFLIVRDCWEHHTLFVQPLLVLLALAGLSTRRTVLLWALLAGPSLWWIWQRSGYHGNLLAETAGLLYFWQRPAGFLLLLWMASSVPFRLPGTAEEPTSTKEVT